MMNIVAVTGFSFKELLFDSGWIWLVMLLMGVVFVFDVINDIRKQHLK